MNAQEVRAYAERAAAGDMMRHICPLNLDLNPFCTPSARNDWQRGFDGLGPKLFGLGVECDTIYQRGAAAARLVQSNKENNQ